MTETMATTAAPGPLLRYFQVVGRSRTWLTALWMLLGLPLGVASFTYAVTLAALGLGLSVTIIGIPLLIAFLFSVRALAAVEGRLAAFMLGADVPPAPFAAIPQAPGLLARIGAILRDSLTWRSLLYMTLRLPVGIATFTLAITLLGLVVGLLVAPLTADGAHLHLFSLRADSQAAAWACTLTGMLLLPAVLHVLNGAGWACGQLTRVLLRPITTPQLP